MASSLDNELLKKQQATAPTAASNPSEAVKSTPYSGLNGLSENTSAMLGKYSQGFQPSQNVTAAQDYLSGIVNSKPGAYQSGYKQQLDSLYKQVMERQPFSFDLNGDVLYQQYKDQYTSLGKKAMQDTMGQAAALTGGYGNSYAATAGNQAYQNYLTQLNDIVPELYREAYERYAQEGADLQNRLNLTQGLEDSEYGRYRDTVSDWKTERDYANNDYWNRYNAEYSDYQNMLSYYNQLAQQESSQWSADRDYAYNYAMNMLNNGLMPDQSWLNKAGISSADAQKIVDANKKSSGGGSGRSSKRSGGSKTTASVTEPITTTPITTTDVGKSNRGIMGPLLNSSRMGQESSTANILAAWRKKMSSK